DRFSSRPREEEDDIEKAAGRRPGRRDESRESRRLPGLLRDRELVRVILVKAGVRREETPGEQRLENPKPPRRAERPLAVTSGGRRDHGGPAGASSRARRTWPRARPQLFDLSQVCGVA